MKKNLKLIEVTALGGNLHPVFSLSIDLFDRNTKTYR